MRVSVDKDDVGYSPVAFGCKVLFEGKEIGHCVTADEERQLVIVYKLDDRGKHILTPNCESVEKETRYGNVRIELSPAYNSWLMSKNQTV